MIINIQTHAQKQNNKLMKGQDSDDWLIDHDHDQHLALIRILFKLNQRTECLRLQSVLQTKDKGRSIRVKKTDRDDYFFFIVSIDFRMLRIQEPGICGGSNKNHPDDQSLESTSGIYFSRNSTLILFEELRITNRPSFQIEISTKKSLN